MQPIVTLLSDFGTRDGFVGAMKGVVATRAPGVLLVDLTHDIPPQDVVAGARALRQAVPYFPPGSIHLAVVDPGVGSARRGLLLSSQGRLLLGPDNGLLSLCASEDSEAWELDRPELFLPSVSATFHGRDVFASVAGYLAAGRQPDSCGTPIATYVKLVEPAPREEPDALIGQVLQIDRFGNLITNLRRGQLDDQAGHVWLEGRDLGPIRSTYADVEPGEWLSYWGSSGELEIALREGSAAAQLPAPLGAGVKLCKRC